METRKHSSKLIDSIKAAVHKVSEGKYIDKICDPERTYTQVLEQWEYNISNSDTDDAPRVCSSGMEAQWRHEWKYEISVSDAAVLRSRIQAVADCDFHAQNGQYHIHSLYFDNYNNVSLRSKLDGVNPREKFRIRYYNNDFSSLRLEKKIKQNRLGTKFTVSITEDIVRDILNGSMASENAYSHPLLLELYSKMRYSGLRPITVVDYTREPYQFEAGNVRVTFDFDISTRWNPEDFLKLNCVAIPAGYPPRMMGDFARTSIMEGNREESSTKRMPGVSNIIQWKRPALYQDLEGKEKVITPPVAEPPVIMEVKWDHFLPDIIRDVIQMPGIAQTAFSKYAQCRSFL